tara:strand:+ start:5143 stop:6966 length:1824 start_codon:yes stop_codon:yes gene_type:complete
LKKLGIGFSSNTKVLLNHLKKHGFVEKIAYPGCNTWKETVDHKFDIKKILHSNWQSLKELYFVGSVGAVVRLINPLLESKENDPGIIVIDRDGKHILPLIGGHYSSMNNKALEISNLLQSKVIFTSSKENQDQISIDSFGFDWGWKRSGSKNDWKNLVIKHSNSGQIIFDQKNGTDLWTRTSAFQQSNLVSLNDFDQTKKTTDILQISSENTNLPCWHPSTLWIGIGCERNTSKNLIDRAIKNYLSANNLSFLAIAGFASIDIKRDEFSIIELAKDYQLPIRFFSPYTLSQIKVPNPSEIVEKEIGTKSVAEASSILAAGNESILIAEKKVFHPINSQELGAVSIAISESNAQYAPYRGEIHLISSGPGDISFITPEARMALSKCLVWIGYAVYLDLIEPLRRSDQLKINSRISEEKDRCQKAIDLAKQGINVAIVSSGDCGIYGMAGLAIEMLLREEKVVRPSLKVHPGISSVMLASARIGAPLMQDFCCISLSDKLIAWEIIESRIIAAAKGDFVVALFNPQSQERQWHLKKTLDILSKERSKNTPILFARQIGRIEEHFQLFNFETFDISQVDMFSLVLVGNSQSKVEDGFFYTSRGYFKYLDC